MQLSRGVKLAASLAGGLAIAISVLVYGLIGAQGKPDYLAEGNKHFEEKSYLKAYEAYERFLKDNPEYADQFALKLRMGHAQTQLGNYDLAETQLKALADSDKLTDLQKGRANYRLGHFYVNRPQYYYVNSKGEKSWGRWIADSSYHHVERENAEQGKDRLFKAYELLKPAGEKAVENLTKDGAEALAMAEEAFNAGLDATAAMHTWQYQLGSQQQSIDYFDEAGQKQTYYYWRPEFTDRDAILKLHDDIAKFGESLRDRALKAQMQRIEHPAPIKTALATAVTRGRDMAALATYRKGCFLVSYAQLDDWNIREMLYHPQLDGFDPLAGAYSPIPVFESVYAKYHDTSFADDAQYFVGYCYQQVGKHDLAVKAYQVLIKDEAFKESTETSSARYNLQQILATRLSVETVASDKDISSTTTNHTWANNQTWYFRQNRGTPRSVFKKGETLGLWVESRNAAKLEVRALTFNLPGLMNDAEFQNARTGGLGHIGDPVLAELVKKYMGEKIFAKNYATGDDGRHRYTRMVFQLPETLPPGSYIIETDTGNMVDRRLVCISDAQLVLQTYGPRENQILFVDATTGTPIADAQIVYKRWQTRWNNDRYNWRIDVSKYAADAQGRLRVPTAGSNDWDGYLVYAEANGRHAFVQAGFEWWQRRGWNDYNTADTRMYAMSDRPVYRPGETVQGKIILRQRDGGEWRNVSGSSFVVRMYNPRGEEKLNTTIRATDYGAVQFEMPLAKDAALGTWYYYVQSSGGNWIGSAYLQVEEYKKPEFEVKVSPPEMPVKLGQAVSASIKGEYYFGGPAAGADVNYRVYRNYYFHSVYFPRAWDWLYNWQSANWYGTPDQQFYRNSASELVTQGTGKLNEQGELVIEWSTQKALNEWGEYDHVYRVEADVTDSSRRTISGQGSVKALRRAFFAFVDNRLGYYRPGDRLDVEVRTVTADDKPVMTKGKLEIHKITWSERKDAEGMPQIDETKTLMRTLDLSTDERGNALFQEKWPESGTFELRYVTQDEWGTEIVGSTRIIVMADKWTPGSYRFGTISLIPQERAYTEKQTAKVLLASDFTDAWMLISVMGGREVISQQYVNLMQSGGQLQLELTIERAHVPNFHINVMTVRNGELHTNTVELFVPPVDQFLDVKVTTDKEWYQPGEKGKFTVTARDKDGKPVQGEFAVSIYDRSITYIMPDSTPNILKHFYGDRRWYQLSFTNSYNTQVAAMQWDHQKYEDIRWYGEPLGYGVHNWIHWERNAFDFNEDVSRSERFSRGFEGDRKKLDRADEAQGGPADGKLKDGDSLRRAGGGGRAPGGESGAESFDKESGNAAPPSAKPSAPMEDGGGMALEEAEKSLDDSMEELAKDTGTAAPRVRSNFKDSVFYSHSVITGADGTATVEIQFPDNLTDWRITARGITKQAKVGEAFHAVKTTKKLILRDQAPRFFVEGDVVTLSGIIMNRYDTALAVKAVLSLNPKDTATKEELAAFCAYELFPETPELVEITVPAGGEYRVDWRVRMKGAGTFKIRMAALSVIESDATEKSYPCKVRGAEMYQSVTSVIRDTEQKAEFTVDLPEQLDPHQTNLDLQLSPSVAALAMDALPYLLEYPYGCVEQTMSRFLPAVIVRKTLADAGLSLEEIGERRKKLAYEGVNPQAAYWYSRNPVFDTSTMNSIITAGLDRLRIMQQGSGGWGWWQSGDGDTYMSAYVCYGLQTAKNAGVEFDFSILDRGIAFLGREARNEKNLHRAAYIAWVLSYAGKVDKELLDKVYDRRDDLTHLSRAMICMAEYLAGDKERARILVSNIEDYRKEDVQHGTVWWEGGKDYWWWWNDKIETNAFVMQAITMVEPKNQHLEKHVRWLAQNRKGSRWNSTKDTSHAVSALMAYARATGELSRTYSVSVKMNGNVMHTWDVTPQNVFSLQTNFRMKGIQLPPGKHTFTIERKGEGKVYFSSFLSYFSKEDKLKASGNEIGIDRLYYRLKPRTEEVTVRKHLGNNEYEDVKEQRLVYDREKLEYGAQLVSGELLEVELNLSSKNDYEYLAFEDFKPAGCEPVALRSGQGYAGGLCQNVELRDDRVAFFVSYMPQGTARLKYQLRCEIPGTFSALPTQGGSMYVAEVRANSEEFKLNIIDK